MDSSTSLDDLPISITRTEDFVVVSKPKLGIALVEARLRDKSEQHSITNKGFQQIQSRLERELNSPATDNASISMGMNLLTEPGFHGRFPRNMFHSVEVIEFQGFLPDSNWIRARDVEIRVVVYDYNCSQGPAGGLKADSGYGSLLDEDLVDGKASLYGWESRHTPRLHVLQHTTDRETPRFALTAFVRLGARGDAILNLCFALPPGPIAMPKLRSAVDGDDRMLEAKADIFFAPGITTLQSQPTTHLEPTGPRR
ncbi:thyroid receptor-interacting protein 13 [Zalerion maritima]|uniref:Thyroid receptor-interacting protein 13 n=1 Tax=Zalerion maritima TaxID=339359 RepID=A0AAD5WNJ1_9PEZI|nr:thyroid receptor-interacting protein 13 [Zalerion maritima]